MKKAGIVAGIVVVLLGASWLLFHRPIKKFLRGAKEVSTGRFQDPEGLAVDSAGRIYVSDEDRGTLTVLSPEGATLRTLKRDFLHGDSLVAFDLGRIVTIGEHELWKLDLGDESNPVAERIDFSKPVTLVDPEGIAFEPKTGRWYVTLEDTRWVRVLFPDLKMGYQFRVPHDPEGIGLLPDGRLLITYSKDDYCQVFTTGGDAGPVVGRPGTGPGEFDNPDFVLTGPDGRVYITDQKNHRIQVFDRDLKPVEVIGKRGKGPGEFEDPEDLAFNQKGELLVADGGNHRIQIFKPTGEFVAEIR